MGSTSGGSDRRAARIASIASAKAVVADRSVGGASKRHSPRTPVYRLGRVTVAVGVHINCMIVDASVYGVRIELDGASALPEFVSLKIVATGEMRRARVAWRTEKSAGLSFRLDQRSAFGNAPRA